tara:strand:+ start:414 stop:797 length:384 start_codon:yes stop_codon:yes gene_type:complete
MKDSGKVLLFSVVIIVANLIFWGGLMYVENILIDYPIALLGLEKYEDGARLFLYAFWVIVFAYSFQWYKQKRKEKNHKKKFEYLKHGFRSGKVIGLEGDGWDLSLDELKELNSLKNQYINEKTGEEE